MPERPIKKIMLHFLQVIDFKRHGVIFIHTHMYVYFRETNQVTKPSELMEAAASADSVHEVVLFGCTLPPCSAGISLERFSLLKKEFFFIIQHISCTETVFLYCNYPIHSDIDLATGKSHDFESDSPVSGICKTADFLINFESIFGDPSCVNHLVFTIFKAVLITWVSNFINCCYKLFEK